MENESLSVLHHVEICVKEESQVLELLVSGFDFKISHFRRHKNATQWLLQSGKSIFIVTKHSSGEDFRCEHPNELNEDAISENSNPALLDTDFEYPLLLCSCVRKEHVQDSVFNVVLKVKDVDAVYKKIKQENTRVLQEPTTIQDKHGSIRLAIVGSKCENVVHCLIDKSKYFGDFLPGFKEVSNLKDNGSLNMKKPAEFKKPLTNFIDHVSIVCRCGESDSVIDWYQTCFNMKRFFANRDDTVEDGFVLEGVIGLRMKALEYWRCAETGVTTKSQINSANTLKLVIAEPLPNVEKGQIANFLVENDGPGVQHIAFNCKSIVHVVNEMSQRGVRFRMPPSTYYDQIKNLEEILDNTVKNSYKDFCKSGVLIDVEEDLLNDKKEKYLLQIFTFPIFEKDTFFLEVIERYGANGFGAGNIKALAISIARYQNELIKEDNC